MFILHRLTDETYTVDEVKEVLRDISSEVCSDIESELINSAHTNVLLLQQIFGQAEKWHLNLDADLAELENRSDIKLLLVPNLSIIVCFESRI